MKTMRLFLTLTLFAVALMLAGCPPNDNPPNDNPPNVNPPVVSLELVKWALETSAPNYVNIVFQALDSSGRGVTGLTTQNFQVQENGKAVSPTESNLEIKKQDRLPYTFYTVLLLDNSFSVGSSLASIRTAAKTLVDGMGEKQQLAVYSFSESVVPVIDFTGIDGKQAIKNAIDTITLGFPTTNLYGAVILGANRWADNYALSGFSQGAMVLLTDGSDTQASSTLQDALYARGSKRCYTIGLGAEIDGNALRQLGNAGYFQLASFTGLAATFEQIQADIASRANSFYLLRYNSPTRGPNSHSLSVSAVSPYTSNTMSDSFSSRDFYSVMPGIYVNVDHSNRDGIRDVDFLDGRGQQVTLSVHTYHGAPGIEPVYAVSPGDGSICRVVEADGGTITIEALFPGETTLTIQDTASAFEIILNIRVRAIVPNVSGLPEAAARTAITGSGFAVGTVTRKFDATVLAGHVISQNPPSGVSVAAGSTVALVVCTVQPSLSVTPGHRTVWQDGGTTTFSVANTGTGTMNWSANVTSGGSWCRITSGMIGTNSGTVRVAFDANPDPGPDPDPRTAEITVTATGAEGSPLMITVVQGGVGYGEVTILLPGGVPLELVRIPAGSFQMGSPDTERSRNSDEGPAHTVNIGYDFYMGKHEVTQAQWLAVMGSRPGGNTWNYGQGDNYPAYYVSWDDAQAFITAVNNHLMATGQGPLTLRLPSEAEWEYACRSETTTRFHFGDSLGVADSCEDDGVRGLYMWYCGNNASSGQPGYGTKPVGGKLPNAFGLYDMHGNIWEWCEDWWHDNYTGAPTDGSAWIVPSASPRVIRGGTWYDYARSCRSAFRSYNTPSSRNRYIGFRLASVR